MTAGSPHGDGAPVSMMPAPLVDALAMPASTRDLFALTKPRVMSLVIFTALCGLLAAPGTMHPVLAFTAILSVALGAGASGALNQWYEADIDGRMRRTAGRPLPAGRMNRQTALHFGVGLSVFSVILCGMATNWVAAAILGGSILFYVFVYTIWLKPRTPQNIVIGGAAGAFPPLIGWAAATGEVAPLALLLFAIIFLWTPPHFWALALFMRSDYAAAGIPMLPVVAGQGATRRQIMLYTLLMAAAAMAPVLLGQVGLVYAVVTGAATLVFMAMAAQVGLRTSAADDAMRPEKRLFAYSILYLFLVFAVLVVDRWQA